MPEDTKPGTPSDEGTPSDGTAVDDKAKAGSDTPKTVSVEEFEKLKKQYDDSVKGFNAKSQDAAAKEKRIAALEAKIAEVETAKQTVTDAEARTKRLEELSDEFGSDKAAQIQLEAEERQKRLESELKKELKDLKDFKSQIEYERYETKIDKTLLKAGVDPDTDAGQAVKALCEKNASMRSQRGENFNTAFADEVQKRAELYKGLNLGTKPPVKKPEKEAETKGKESESLKIPTGGQTPPDNPKKPRYQSNEERRKAMVDSYAKYQERSEG